MARTTWTTTGMLSPTARTHCSAIAQRSATLSEWHSPVVPHTKTPLTLASFAAGPRVEVYAEYLAVGAVLPDISNGGAQIRAA